jgi:hypothetical protein
MAALQTLNPLRHPAPPVAAAAAPPSAAPINESRSRRGPPREGGAKDTDLATLGNLCVVDVVLGVPRLPPAPRHERQAYMERLAASPPDQVGFQLS